LSSCKKDINAKFPDISNPVGDAQQEGIKMQLGKKMRNPYSISNMTAAYWSWRSKFRGEGDFPSGDEIAQIIVSTNTYYRTLPIDEEAYELLRQDTTKEFFDFPLDYELSGGNTYRDPNLEDTVLSWQYTVVPNSALGSQRMTGENIEILTNDIFLPENSPYYNEFDTTFWNAIENEALILAGYPEEAAAINAYKGGTIKIFQEVVTNLTNYVATAIVPLEGAKIVGRNFWRHAHGYTDVNGLFTLNKDLRGSINYFIKWERPGKYDIRSGWYGQAWSVIGKKPTTSLWEYTIQPSDRDGFDIFYGSIHRGAYDFFYHDPWGFSKPSARIKIGGLKGEGTGVNSHAASILAGPDIRVWKKSSNGLNKKTDLVYGTTIHEFGHSSHRSLGVNRLIFCSNMFRESYANMIEWLFCSYKHFTADLDSPTNNIEYSYNYVKYSFDIDNNNLSSTLYTPMFIDLFDVDTDNTYIYIKSPSSTNMIESISFDPLVLEHFLDIKPLNAQEDKNLIDLRDYLKAQPNTPANVDTDIDNYINTYYLPYKFEK
jgi:hypothetical protein